MTARPVSPGEPRVPEVIAVLTDIRDLLASDKWLSPTSSAIDHGAFGRGQAIAVIDGLLATADIPPHPATEPLTATAGQAAWDAWSSSLTSCTPSEMAELSEAFAAGYWAALREVAALPEGREDGVRPGLYEAPFGTTLRDLIALAGGVPGGRPIQAVLLGGAAGAFVGPEELDVLRLALLKFGQHGMCAVLTDTPVNIDQGTDKMDPACDCGLAAALSATPEVPVDREGGLRHDYEARQRVVKLVVAARPYTGKGDSVMDSAVEWADDFLGVPGAPAATDGPT